MSRPLVIASCAMLACASVASAAPLTTPSAFSVARAPWSFASTPPAPAFAQRVIEREWGPSDDSVYVEVDVPGLKSEALATSMSAILPGTGQLYVEEGSGWLFLAMEAGAWGGWWWYKHDSKRLNDDAAAIAGPPGQAGSGWSFERWANASEGDPTALAQLYAVDRHAFYNAIGSNPDYASGWADPAAHAEFLDLRGHADSRLRQSRVFATGLWINHLVAAVDALRAARFHNMPLKRNMAMKIQTRGNGRNRGAAMVFEVKF